MATVQKTTDSSSLAEVVDRILDKGIVIDVWARVSLESPPPLLSSLL